MVNISFPYSLRFSLTIINFSQTKHGDTYDCVNIYKQSIFEHPSFKNHTIQVHIVTLFALYFHQNLNSISRYPRKWLGHAQAYIVRATIILKSIDLITHNKFYKSKDVPFYLNFKSNLGNEILTIKWFFSIVFEI